MKIPDKKEMLSIPNCMGYFRILLIPVFCTVYLKADTIGEQYLAAGILLVSTITDFLDGQVARRCNMITEFGKMLDPVADKLTHAALAVCLAFRYPAMKYLIALMIVKEGFMAVMGVVNMRHGCKLKGAKWFGKVCTATLFFLMLALVVFPEIDRRLARNLIIAEMVIMFLTLIFYIPVFYKMKQEWKK